MRGGRIVEDVAAGGVVALALLVSAGCRRSDPSTGTAPTAKASASSVPATPSAAPTASEVPAEADSPSPSDDVIPNEEWLNEGCKHRKNSGIVQSCEPAIGHLGDWAPTRAEAREIMKVATGSCYCAGSLVPQVDACAKMQATGAVKVKIGRDGEPTDCTVTLRAGTWSGRRFVVVDAINRDQATFYSVNQIVERTKTGYRLYFTGFNGVPGETDIPDGGEGVSPEIRTEWPTLPPELKAFFDPNTADPPKPE